MVQQSVVEYIRRLLEQGYDAGVIRSTLINAGHSPSDVDVAMRAAGAGGKKVSTKILVFAFVALLVLSGVVLLVLKVMQPPEAELEFSLSLFSSVVGPGQEVVVTADVRNPGRPVSGLIDYVVSGPEGRLLSATESFSVTDQASVPTSIRLPSRVAPGAYQLRATMSYEGKSQARTVNFEVRPQQVEMPAPVEALEREAEVEAEERGKACPAGCDDLNFCTRDECVGGECVHSPIVPCCGNQVCEEGESASSCSVDCAERRETPEGVQARAEALAETDVAGAVSVCESMGQQALVAECLRGVADVSGRKDVCGRIAETETRDACLLPFAYQGDFSVCDEITGKFLKNSCVSLRQLQG